MLRSVTGLTGYRANEPIVQVPIRNERAGRVGTQTGAVTILQADGAGADPLSNFWEKGPKRE